jgi:hypothetical protein
MQMVDLRQGQKHVDGPASDVREAKLCLFTSQLRANLLITRLCPVQDELCRPFPSLDRAVRTAGPWIMVVI